MVTGKSNSIIEKVHRKTAYRIEVYPSVLDSSGIALDNLGKSKDRNKKQHTIPFSVYHLF